MIDHITTAFDVGWGDIPVGAFFKVAHRNSCTEKAWGKLFRKVSVETAIDVEDTGRPQTDIFFCPSDKGFAIVTAAVAVPLVARELTAHKVNGLNEALRIFVLDQPGHGGACHAYTILVPCDHDGTVTWAEELPEWSTWELQDGTKLGSLLYVDKGRERACIQRMRRIPGKKEPQVYLEFFDAVSMAFQNGPIKENGINGISQEALIAVLIDRLEGFQSGQFQCHDNQVALDSLQNARLWLHKRTMDRVARGVEGTTAA